MFLISKIAFTFPVYFLIEVHLGFLIGCHIISYFLEGFRVLKRVYFLCWLCRLWAPLFCLLSLGWLGRSQPFHWRVRECIFFWSYSVSALQNHLAATSSDFSFQKLLTSFICCCFFSHCLNFREFLGRRREIHMINLSSSPRIYWRSVKALRKTTFGLLLLVVINGGSKIYRSSL